MIGPIVYKMIVGTFFPVFFSFYLGAWCDLFGRKLIFKMYLSAKCVEQIIVIVCAYFLESPKEWLLLAPIPTALAGKIEKSTFSCLDHTFPVHLFYQLYMQETGNLNITGLV